MSENNKVPENNTGQSENHAEHRQRNTPNRKIQPLRAAQHDRGDMCMKFKNEVIIMENYGTGACIAEHNGDMTINVISKAHQDDQMLLSINGMSISDYVHEQIAKGKATERRAKQQAKQALREALKRLEDE